ncbi:MAG TPA: DUF3106 domain-containing protein [Verrucomicrobiae bacterium]|nr:DUF3106 domain-containing protein [Verrucomicrobiae bacterium]
MRKKTQFGALVLAGIGFVAMPGSGWAQQPHGAGNPAPNVNRPAQNPPPPHPNANRPPVNPNRAPQNPNRPGGGAPQVHAGPQRNFNNGARPGGARPNLTPRQQLGVGAARPWVDRMRDLSPQQRENVLQNSRAFQNLSPEQQGKIRQQFKQWDGWTPQQRADQRTKEETWRQMTPQQRDHIKNDVLPKWRQMPWDRQQAMRQKLGVLQNMPESARNQRLNDPNFTRGMSDDERSMLKDLSHTHVGGAPEPPGE